MIAVQPHDKVLEIGPGRGALTSKLRTSTSDLTLFEIDRDLVRFLQSQWSDTDIVEGDVLDLPIERFDGRRVVGNLPYNIATPLISKLASSTQVIDMHFMVQREVADRLEAKPDSRDFGRLTVMTQSHCYVEKLFDVPASAFDPPPQVESSFVYLRHRESHTLTGHELVFEQIVKSAFAQRRKTLSNSLKSFDIDWQQAQVDPKSRAENVSVAQFVALSRATQRL